MLVLHTPLYTALYSFVQFTAQYVISCNWKFQVAPIGGRERTYLRVSRELDIVSDIKLTDLVASTTSCRGGGRQWKGRGEPMGIFRLL